MTKSTIKGVDISFGLDTYDQSAAGGTDETTTSLSYEVRKSLLNNRAQIEVSGRVSDGTQTTGSSDHSLNNVSFEYQLDSAASKYLKVYNEHTYDDVFDGEVIETGIGFSYRKRYKTFKDIWLNAGNPVIQKLRDKSSFADPRCKTCKFFALCKGNYRFLDNDPADQNWINEPACYLTDDEIK